MEYCPKHSAYFSKDLHLHSISWMAWKCFSSWYIYIFFFLCIKSNSSNKKKMVNFFLGRKYYCFTMIPFRTMIRSKLNFFQDIFIIVFILNTTRYKLYLKKKKNKVPPLWICIRETFVYLISRYPWLILNRETTRDAFATNRHPY